MKCTICGAKFARPSYLADHGDKYHGGQGYTRIRSSLKRPRPGPTEQIIDTDDLVIDMGEDRLGNDGNETIKTEYFGDETIDEVINSSANQVPHIPANKIPSVPAPVYTPPVEYQDVADVDQYVIHLERKQVHFPKDPNGQFMCLDETCSYTAKKLAHIERHYRTHTGERPYQCKLCDGRFVEKVRSKLLLRKNISFFH